MISYWLALSLAFLALLFYVANSILIRCRKSGDRGSLLDFNLGLPKTRNNEGLFAVTLVAAGTSISTVFVFFLTAGTLYGSWLFLCPLFFALGNWVMYQIFARTAKLGYFDEGGQRPSGRSGLVPYLAQRLTGSRRIGWLLVVLSLVNLLAVLVLELVVGVDVLGYLAKNTLHTPISSAGAFGLFAFSVVLMLAYVFIGGFRAVVVSDVWGIRIMSLAILVTFVSVLTLVLTTTGQKVFNTAYFSRSPGGLVLSTFVLNIVLGNLFIPLAQEASWQRFRAFGSISHFDFRRAVRKSVIRAVILWSGLISLAFLLEMVLSPERVATLTSMSSVLEALLSIKGNWFSLLVFPLMTVAALSAMYSTADTCVSAILYLVGYGWYSKEDIQVGERKVPRGYYVAMLAVLLLSLGAYVVVRVWFNPTLLQMVFSVFSNLIVVAPTVITTAFLRPLDDDVSSRRRVRNVAGSLIIGSAVFWGTNLVAMSFGETLLWLSQLSLALGLVGALIPLLPLWLSKRS